MRYACQNEGKRGWIALENLEENMEPQIEGVRHESETVV